METANGLEVRDLRLVTELARVGSFTLAAENLHLSQSAFSRAINDIERRLGTRLFDRTTRTVALTMMGAEFIRIARTAIDNFDAMMREFGLFQSGQRGLVKVATLPSFAATVMPRVLSAMVNTGLRIELRDVSGLGAAELLRSAEVDYAITAQYETGDDLAFTPLLRDRFRVMFSPRHRFSGRTAVTWAEALDEQLILPLPSSSVRSLINRTLNAHQLSAPHVVQAESVSVIAGMVSEGLGVTLMPEHVAPLMSFVPMESAELCEPIVDRTLGLLSVPGRTTSPAALRFADHLTDLMPGV